MSSYTPSSYQDEQTILFCHEEELWFWFMGANQARLDGATGTRTKSGPVRPCEPVDVLRILDRLYRARLLTMDHFRILRHYGERQIAPDRWKPREARAAVLWREAMQILREQFLTKGLIELPESLRQDDLAGDNMIWMHEAANRLSSRWGVSHYS